MAEINNRSRFHTRGASEVSVRVPLPDPLTEKASGSWIECVGIASDTYRVAFATCEREITAVYESFREHKDQARADLDVAACKSRLVARCCTGWSEDLGEFTHADVAAFFREAPQIQHIVDQVISKRALFLLKEKGAYLKLEDGHVKCFLPSKEEEPTTTISSPPSEPEQSPPS